MYGVKFVDGDALPEGHQFMLVRRPGDVLLFLDSGNVTEQVLSEAWAAYRHTAELDPPLHYRRLA